MAAAVDKASPTAAKQVRNQAMECCKMLASILVVFLHVCFPGKTGDYIGWFSCFAVPTFFAVTGYFNYGAGQTAVVRRLKHNLRLYMTAIAVNLAYGVFATECLGGSTAAYLIQYFPKPEEWANWFAFHVDPRGGHLWYLTAACVCYVFLWMYVCFFGEEPVNYRPLYGIGTALFSVFLALGILAPPVGMNVEYLLYRNGFFMGLPMFIFGIFIHQYQDRILRNYRLTTKKLLGLVLLGAFLGVFQGQAIGMGQMTLGAVVEVAALMLLLVSHPVLVRGDGIWRLCISKFGSWSTYIYLFHITVYQFYCQFLQAAVAAAFPEKEPYLCPIIVAALSFLTAVAAERIEWMLKRMRGRSR